MCKSCETKSRRASKLGEVVSPPVLPAVEAGDGADSTTRETSSVSIKEEDSKKRERSASRGSQRKARRSNGSRGLGRRSTSTSSSSSSISYQRNGNRGIPRNGSTRLSSKSLEESLEGREGSEGVRERDRGRKEDADYWRFKCKCGETCSSYENVIYHPKGRLFECSQCSVWSHVLCVLGPKVTDEEIAEVHSSMQQFASSSLKLLLFSQTG